MCYITIVQRFKMEYLRYNARGLKSFIYSNAYLTFASERSRRNAAVERAVRRYIRDMPRVRDIIRKFRRKVRRSFARGSLADWAGWLPARESLLVDRGPWTSNRLAPWTFTFCAASALVRLPLVPLLFSQLLHLSLPKGTFAFTPSSPFSCPPWPSEPLFLLFFSREPRYSISRLVLYPLVSARPFVSIYSRLSVAFG